MSTYGCQPHKISEVNRREHPAHQRQKETYSIWSL